MNIETKDLLEYMVVAASIVAAWNKMNTKHERIEDKINAIEKKFDKEISDINMTLEKVIETHQALTSGLTELNVHSSDFAKRAEQNWERNEINFDRVFKRIDAFDEGIKKFYRDNSKFNFSDDTKDS